ncbi:hypothetical protein ACWT_3887 [Actinoplanes sp. SE50]|uniref:hypothetical protein n=1 Tax=unclassified Actinoplanes TaxID=2626549 RepID=UPI00023ED08D|nr:MULTISPECIES: hypothetical protein [unclassified Actinoplanes]AEV84911.1 hypothetical protein ACPL_4016 [Actinoplanes sp. SE50/110]ATO83302.1 hypothetical protein ACWT_3887 [Actinoplanes sp. SE50]SLM00709.1 hypothetical protein ACSP50_3942 [Actinoplanes sp. SE50/110]
MTEILSIAAGHPWPAAMMMLSVGLSAVLRRWIDHLTACHREEQVTRRLFVALRDSSRRDRPAIVRACGPVGGGAGPGRVRRGRPGRAG